MILLFFFRYGDMRVMMGCEIFSMWQNLGEPRPRFLEQTVAFELHLSSQDQLLCFEIKWRRKRK